MRSRSVPQVNFHDLGRVEDQHLAVEAVPGPN
jgi:hypothetical protein